LQHSLQETTRKEFPEIALRSNISCPWDWTMRWKTENQRNIKISVRFRLFRLSTRMVRTRKETLTVLTFQRPIQNSVLRRLTWSSAKADRRCWVMQKEDRRIGTTRTNVLQIKSQDPGFLWHQINMQDKIWHFLSDKDFTYMYGKGTQRSCPNHPETVVLNTYAMMKFFSAGVNHKAHCLYYMLKSVKKVKDICAIPFLLGCSHTHGQNMSAAEMTA